LTLLDKLLREADNSRDELIEILQNLVKIETVNTGVMPTGNETELCQYLKKKLDSEEIESEIIEGVPTRGNLIARLNGSENGRARLMFMSHTDVVPIGDESKWLHPPFSGKVDNGRLYGRGANDCKGLTACETMVTILLKRLNIPLKKSLILAAGSDEETGSNRGFRWLAANRRSAISAEYAVNEGGGDAFQTPNALCFGLALGEKGRLEAGISIAGKSCHASVPWQGNNVLLKLSQIIQKINNYHPELSVSAPAFRELPRLFGIKQSEITVENIENLIQAIYGESELVGSMLRGLSRMTVTPTMVSCGIKSNVVPDECELICDIRVLPGQNIEYVQKELEDVLSDVKDCQVKVGGTTNPSASPPDDTFLKAIRRSLIKATGTNADIMQTLTVGFTDSSAVRPLGTVVYNFAPTHPDSDTSKDNVHGDNESIAVDDLVFRTKTLAALAYEMLT